MKLRPNRILAQPATVQACTEDRTQHTPQRQADSVTQKVETRQSGAEKARAWRGRRT